MDCVRVYRRVLCVRRVHARVQVGVARVCGLLARVQVGGACALMCLHVRASTLRPLLLACGASVSNREGAVGCAPRHECCIP